MIQYEVREANKVSPGPHKNPDLCIFYLRLAPRYSYKDGGHYNLGKYYPQVRVSHPFNNMLLLLSYAQRLQTPKLISPCSRTIHGKL